MSSHRSRDPTCTRPRGRRQDHSRILPYSAIRLPFKSSTLHHHPVSPTQPISTSRFPNTTPCSTGLDGYRTELAVWAAPWSRFNIATLILEIPGTGDSPASPSDATSPDRLWSSLLAWIHTAAPSLDRTRLIAWGFSTGGFYALRLAHTHAASLLAVVSLGGGAHHMFDPRWLDSAQHLEYPFDLGSTLAYKFGYHGADGFARFKAEAQRRYSLLLDGTLDRPCCRTLLVNGTDDEIFPADDYLLAIERGGPKEIRLVRGAKHMGEPASFGIVVQWIFGLLGVDAQPGELLKGLPFRAKYP